MRPSSADQVKQVEKSTKRAHLGLELHMSVVHGQPPGFDTMVGVTVLCMLQDAFHVMVSNCPVHNQKG